jgi:hypothetical protein
VGPREPIARTLRRWGFRKVRARSHREYWVHDLVGLVDLVGPRDRSGLAPRRVGTPHGPAWIGAAEPLILRRLSRAARERSEALFAQALALASDRELDWEYLEVMARYEGIERDLKELRTAIGKRSTADDSDRAERSVGRLHPRQAYSGSLAPGEWGPEERALTDPLRSPGFESATDSSAALYERERLA